MDSSALLPAAPVREMIRDGENGLLAEFFSAEAMAEKAVTVLRDPDAARPLGRAAERMIVDRYSLDAVIPEMVRMYEDTAAMNLPSWPVPPMSNQPPAVPVTPARPSAAPPTVVAPPPHVPPLRQPGPKKPSPFRG